MAFSAAIWVSSGQERLSRGAMGSGSVGLPAEALIGLERVTVLIDLFVEAEDLLVEGLLGRPPDWMQRRGFTGFADVLQNPLDGCGLGHEGHDPNRTATARADQRRDLKDTGEQDSPQVAVGGPRARRRWGGVRR